MSIDCVVNEYNYVNGNVYQMTALIMPVMDYLLKHDVKIWTKVFPYVIYDGESSLHDADLSELNADEFNLIYKVLKDGWADWSTRDMPDEKKVWFLKKYDELFGYMEEDIRFEK